MDKAAVLEGCPDNAALLAVNALPGVLLDARFDRGEMTLFVDPAQIIAATSAVQQAGYNFLEDVTCVDWYPAAPRFQVTYHILSHRLKERVRLAAMVSESNAAIDSIVNVWPSANFYEREVFDLFGVRFNDHPNLIRIMMPDEWEGHPLRKDYPVEGYR
ncbi:MAG: NADH-quinone oxidoreductase subunit C [Acidobacteriaceae bacterium]|nr:NADH-quinone oxidoreductase subunit C [Acidobacteriaceae bacterium]